MRIRSRTVARAVVLLSFLPALAAGSPAHALECGGAVHVATSHLHVAAVQSDGTVWTWGANWSGQLGDGTTAHKDTPVQVLSPTGSATPFLTGVVEVAAGVDHTLALKSDGTVWAWGANSGLFGDGATASSVRPKQALISDVVQVAAGRHHSLALTASGDVYAWGINHTGQLGFAPLTTTPTTTPRLVAGLSDIVEIAAGDYYSLARRTDGTVFGWGSNIYGQSTGSPSAPVTTPTATFYTGRTGPQANPTIAAGGGHSIVISPAGNPVAFGRNDAWQVGQGLTAGGFATVPTSSLLPTTTAVGVGFAHTFAVSAGTTFGWGHNGTGQLGDPSGGTRPHPAPVPGASPTTLVTGGYTFSVAIVGGTVLTWGSDTYGQLGDGPLVGARPAAAPATCTP